MLTIGNDRKRVCVCGGVRETRTGSGPLLVFFSCSLLLVSHPRKRAWWGLGDSDVISGRLDRILMRGITVIVRPNDCKFCTQEAGREMAVYG